MTTDISCIRNSLRHCEEISPPCPIDKGCIIKYITLKDGNEAFYQGGSFKYMGNKKIVLENKGQTWSVPTCLYDKDGSIKYSPRFFVESATKTCTKDIDKLNSIIQAQQDVIEKMTDQIKQLELKKHSLHEQQTRYEELLQKQRYEIKDKDVFIRKNQNKIKQYEQIIRKLQYYYESHPLRPAS